MHQIRFRIYYEDTDAGGVVYHANYLRFFERARTEWMREQSVDHSMLKQTHALVMLVSNVAMKFIQPAKLDDEILIETQIKRANRAFFVLRQAAYLERDEKVLLVDADISIAIAKWHALAQGEVSEIPVMDFEKGYFKPSRMPKSLYNVLMENIQINEK